METQAQHEKLRAALQSLIGDRSQVDGSLREMDAKVGSRSVNTAMLREAAAEQGLVVKFHPEPNGETRFTLSRKEAPKGAPSAPAVPVRAQKPAERPNWPVSAPDDDDDDDDDGAPQQAQSAPVVNANELAQESVRVRALFERHYGSKISSGTAVQVVIDRDGDQIPPGPRLELLAKLYKAEQSERGKTVSGAYALCHVREIFDKRTAPNRARR